MAQGDFQLGPTDSQTIEVTGPGVFTLRVQGANLSAVADCVELPQLSYGAVCVAPGTAAFTATNSGSAMQSPVDYQILTGAGAVLDSGSFQLGAGQSQTFSVTGFSGLVRMLVAGSPVIDTTCDDGTPPPPPTDPPTTPPPTEPPVTPPPTTPPPRMSRRLCRPDLRRLNLRSSRPMMRSSAARSPSSRLQVAGLASR